jgi:hypothetical protein
LGSVLKNTEVATILGPAFSTVQDKSQFGQQNGLGYINGRIFINSSGHSDIKVFRCM